MNITRLEQRLSELEKAFTNQLREVWHCLMTPDGKCELADKGESKFGCIPFRCQREPKDIPDSVRRFKMLFLGAEPILPGVPYTPPIAKMEFESLSAMDAYFTGRGDTVNYIGLDDQPKHENANVLIIVYQIVGTDSDFVKSLN